MSTPAAPEIRFLEPTLEHALIIWWAWAWRAVLLIIGLGLVTGFAVGLVGALMGLPKETVSTMAGFAGFILGVGASVYVLKRILRKDFGDFRICLLAKSNQ